MGQPVRADNIDDLRDQLRLRAGVLLLKSGKGSPSQADKLVQEALDRLIPSGKEPHEITWPDRQAFLAEVSKTMQEVLGLAVPPGQQDALGSDGEFATLDWETNLTPELRAWALQATAAEEAEIVANLKELREKGGAPIDEFLREMEELVNDGEHAGP